MLLHYCDGKSSGVAGLLRALWASLWRNRLIWACSAATRMVCRALAPLRYTFVSLPRKQRRGPSQVHVYVCYQESVKSDAAPISAEGAAVSAKDKLAQRLALQRVSSSALRVFGAGCTMVLTRLTHIPAFSERERERERERDSHKL